MKQTVHHGRATTLADAPAHAFNARLDSVIRQQPTLRDLGQFYRAILPLMRAAQESSAPLALDEAVARRKLQAGCPLLVGEALPLEEAHLRTLFLQLCAVVEDLACGADQPHRHRSEQGGISRTLFAFFRQGEPDPAELLERVRNGDSTSLRAAAAQQVRQAVAQQHLDLEALWLALLGGDDVQLTQIAGKARLDGDLLRTIGQYTLRPALRRWASTFQGLVDFDNAWSTGVWRHLGCPICGSAPLLSEIQGKECARRLRCAACGLGWGYPRLICAFCGNQDYHRLGYLSVEGEEEKYRLQMCEECRHYLKVVVTFDPLPVDHLVLEDMATLHLDTIAAQQGFRGASTRL